jgi:hypothetical protein
LLPDSRASFFPLSSTTTKFPEDWFINEIKAYQGRKKIVFKTNQYTGFQSNSYADRLELHKTEICSELAKSPNNIPSLMSMEYGLFDKMDLRSGVHSAFK